MRNRIVDMNFMDSFDTLLDKVRLEELKEFDSGVLNGRNLAGKLTFWHITFDDVRDAELRAKRTGFRPTSKSNRRASRSSSNVSTTLSGPTIRNCRNFSGCCIVFQTGLPEKVANPPP